MQAFQSQCVYYRCLFVIVLFSFLIITSCSNKETNNQVQDDLSSIITPRRVEHSNDTTFRFWDSLLLKYTYNPVKRKLTSADKEWYLIRDSTERFAGYINMKGDTVIPLKYWYVPMMTMDTFRRFAFVNLPTELVAIDKNENVLFEVYLFDTMPDKIQDGVFRIERGRKIGFADENGNIIIEPVFDEADQFKNGYCRVGFKCYQEIIEEEHNPVKCRMSAVINKKGQIIFSSKNSDEVNRYYKKLIK